MNSAHRKFWLLVGILVAAILIVACPRPPANHPAGEIIVSAAASLRDAFREIGAVYESRTGTRVNFNFGASGTLQRQIESGAPVDVFASAGRPQMEALAAKGLILVETQRDFAGNALILIAPAGQSPDINSFAELGQARVNKLAIGNPRTVPAGQYAEQSLRRLNLWPSLESRLILAEDVRQVLEYVERGEVDAGIVYASDAKSAGNAVRVLARAPSESHDPILYPLSVVRASSHPAAARAFTDVILAEEGQRILEKFGFERVH